MVHEKKTAGEVGRPTTYQLVLLRQELIHPICGPHEPVVIAHRAVVGAEHGPVEVSRVVDFKVTKAKLGQPVCRPRRRWLLPVMVEALAIASNAVDNMHRAISHNLPLIHRSRPLVGMHVTLTIMENKSEEKRGSVNKNVFELWRETERHSDVNSSP
jgi:hypothetical protein